MNCFSLTVSTVQDALTQTFEILSGQASLVKPLNTDSLVLKTASEGQR